MFGYLYYMTLPTIIHNNEDIIIFKRINYLHDPEKIRELHQQVYTILNPGGLFIYDFTTPHNSRQAIRVLNNISRRVSPEVRFHRESTYHAKSRIHSNNFLIEYRDQEPPHKKRYIREIHEQKIYTRQEIMEIVRTTPFHIVAAYDGFMLKPAHDKSLRVTMVLRK